VRPKALEFRVRQFNPVLDKFESLIRIDRMNYKDPRNHLDIKRIKNWCSVNPNIFSILIDGLGEVYGYTIFAPIKDDLLNGVIERKLDIYQTLGKEHILSEEEAKAAAISNGNAIFADFDFINPESDVVDYDFGMQLLMNLEMLLYKYRVRRLIACIASQEYRSFIENSGCVKLFDLPKTEDGIASVYYFDIEEAKSRRMSGLGAVIAKIWGDKRQKTKLPLALAPREREVIKLDIEGLTYKEIAGRLKTTFFAVDAAWKRIVEKGKNLGLNDRKSIKAYVTKNYPYFL
jgi:DNA-binding CsgD family transcriptional regulator